MCIAFAGASAVQRPIISVARAAKTRAGPTQLLAVRGDVTPFPLAEPARSLAAGWGVFGFIGILAQAIGRLAPIAIQPLIRRDLTILQWSLYALSLRPHYQHTCYLVPGHPRQRVSAPRCSTPRPPPRCPPARRYGGCMLFFAYVEGYKAFQLKFSPLVVQRAMTLSTSPAPPLHHTVLAPFYSMGLFHASKKRKTVSWCISLGVACIIGVVKGLPYPWRSVVDAGVCTGLLWGGTSIAVIYARARAGMPPGVDPELPIPTDAKRQ